MSTEDRTYTSNLVAFAHALRDAGLNVSTDDVVSAARVLRSVDPLNRDQFYYGLRSAIVDEPDQADVFDELFTEYWDDLLDEAFEDATDTAGVADVDERVAESGAADAEETRQFDADPADTPDAGDSGSASLEDPADLTEREGDGRGSDGARDESSVTLEIGTQERSTRPSVAFDERDFATDELSVLVKAFGRQLGVLRGFRRRTQPSGDVDLRRSLDVARHGNPDDLPRAEAARSRAKIRFFVDVSQSMLRNMDQRFLLYFLFESVRQLADVRVFLFDTDATEVTHHFQAANVEGTLDELRRTQTEWGAGTTIGSCLAEILTTDPFVVDRETIAVVVSDGWDAGDEDLLEEQMRGLYRRCRSVLWLNPRAASPTYEPKVGGMQTALPYVTHFFGFTDIDDLRVAVDHLQSHSDVGH